ncbi:MAG: class I SAM-dependent methyltransferase, partial [Myxococcota bacterium]
MHEQVDATYSVSLFNRLSDEERRLQKQATTQWEQELKTLRQLAFPRSGRVLDVGCGTGIPAAALQALGYGIVAVDQDPDALQRCPEDLVTYEASATDLPFENDTFDASYTRLALQHMSTPLRALQE